MLRVLVLGLLLVTAALLQTSLFPFIALGSVRPDLLLLVVVGVALSDGVMPGLRVGFTAGLMTDLLVDQAPVGLAALVFTGVGYTIGLARPYLAPGSLTAPVLLAFVSGLLGTAGYGVLSLLLGDERVTGGMLLQAAASVAIYNTLLAPIVFGIVRRLSDRFPLEAAGVLR
jgi:rod shape-determining protein MreD